MMYSENVVRRLKSRDQLVLAALTASLDSLHMNPGILLHPPSTEADRVKATEDPGSVEPVRIDPTASPCATRTEHDRDGHCEPSEQALQVFRYIAGIPTSILVPTGIPGLMAFSNT